MSVVFDTSILIDVLRGRPDARQLLGHERSHGLVHASEITRTEVLAGMRPSEADPTYALLDVFTWHPVDRAITERAAEFARTYRPGHGGIDIADYLVAATVSGLGARLHTCNVRHFPMFTDIVLPY